MTASETGPNRDYWRLRPRAPMPGTLLCRIEEIEDPGAREFTFGKGKSKFSMFVVKKDGQVYGYLNICPHYSSPLNARAGAFMNEARTRLRCTMHFAEFRIEDGFGVSGAAENCWLDPIPLQIVAGEITIGE